MRHVQAAPQAFQRGSNTQRRRRQKAAADGRIARSAGAAAPSQLGSIRAEQPHALQSPVGPPLPQQRPRQPAGAAAAARRVTAAGPPAPARCIPPPSTPCMPCTSAHALWSARGASGSPWCWPSSPAASKQSPSSALWRRWRARWRGPRCVAGSPRKAARCLPCARMLGTHIAPFCAWEPAAPCLIAARCEVAVPPAQPPQLSRLPPPPSLPPAGGAHA
jgi:hypothetical protein